MGILLNVSNYRVRLARVKQRTKRSGNIKEAIEAVLEVLSQEIKGLGEVAEISTVEVSV